MLPADLKNTALRKTRRSRHFDQKKLPNNFLFHFKICIIKAFDQIFFFT